MLTSSSHDLWTTRIDAAFRDRAPEWCCASTGADEIVVEQGQVLSGIESCPTPCPLRGAGDDLRPSALRGRPRGGSDPDQHLRDMRLDGVAGECSTLRRSLFYFRVADPALMSAIFRADNHHLHF